MKVLIMGWTKIPHSYSIVNVFQLVHLRENFPEMKLYLREEDYFRKEWNAKTSRTLYPESYYKILDSIELWVGQDIDLIYSITYPYNINSLQIKRQDTMTPPLPKCIFYTSEFGKLDINHFNLSTGSKIIDDEFIKNHIANNKNLHFTSPSEWSSKGMVKYLEPDTSRNVVIIHGVDTRIFKKLDPKVRKGIREFYNVKDTDVLLCNIGAMTGNKGIINILQALKVLVIDKKLTHYKLLLKGMQDLYSTRGFIDLYLVEINAPKELYNNIIFIDKTLSFKKLNEIYNSIDLYLSPYIAEGFNLVPLEVMAAGSRVLLPRGGSTKEYSSALEQFNCIEFVDCQLDEASGQNMYNLKDLSSSIVKGVSREPFNTDSVNNYISHHLSWNNAAIKLNEYFEKILNAN
jgi:glycosyltransferase involved in cell wall biosynthesis